MLDKDPTYVKGLLTVGPAWIGGLNTKWHV